MDDALRTRLDRLTWLVAGLLAAVLALGFEIGGTRYFGTIAALGVVGLCVGTVVSSLDGLSASDA